MGNFNVIIGVGHPSEGDLTEVLALVDTGATHTMLPASLLEQHRIEILDEQYINYADGSRGVAGVGQARIAYRGREWTCPVIFGGEDEYLMGATTLEIFNLMVDPMDMDKELVHKPWRARPF